MQYRSVTFGRRQGPWQPTREMAKQEAIEAGEGFRDPDCGTVYLSDGTVIEEAPGFIEMSQEQAGWAKALNLLAAHPDPIGFIDRDLKRPYPANEIARLRDARGRIEILLANARKQEQGKCRIYG